MPKPVEDLAGTAVGPARRPPAKDGIEHRKGGKVAAGPLDAGVSDTEFRMRRPWHVHHVYLVARTERRDG